MTKPKGPQEMTSRLGTLTIIKIGARRFDLADPYHLALSLPWPWFLAVVLIYYTVVNLIFGAIYWLLPLSTSKGAELDFASAFFFSVETFATVGYGQVAPVSFGGHVTSIVEIILGLLSTAVITGLMFVRFARPQARILYSPVAVVCRYDGVPTLMVRIANGRQSPIQDARARLTFVQERITQEGMSSFINQELTLIRDRMPIFALGWTLMHKITEDSPVYGFDFESNSQARFGARLMVAVNGFDEVLTAPVFTHQNYLAEDIRVGHQFVDLMERSGDRIQVNLEKLGQTVPQAPLSA
jgi:inward rectifier potassium channel